MFYLHRQVRIVLDLRTKMIPKDEMAENGWTFLKWKKVSLGQNTGVNNSFQLQCEIYEKWTFILLQWAPVYYEFYQLMSCHINFQSRQLFMRNSI